VQLRLTKSSRESARRQNFAAALWKVVSLEADVKAWRFAIEGTTDGSNCRSAECFSDEKVSINEVPASLGRSIKAVSEQDQGSNAARR